jgi:hypothetical protein
MKNLYASYFALISETEGSIVFLKMADNLPNAEKIGEIKIKKIVNFLNNGLRHYPACFGEVELLPVTYSYNVLVCKTCHLRVSIPSSVITLEDLKNYLEKV